MTTLAPHDHRSADSSGQVILHLGVGSFHRAHQAVYLQGLIDAGERHWSLAGANLRPDMNDVLDGLHAQGGAYTLETVSPASEYRYQRIDAIRRVVAYDAELTEVIRIGAADSTPIISFTVTEAGYYLAPDDHLDQSAPDLATDLARARQGEPGRTIYGALTAILRARMQAGAQPVTLLCCDNLRHNGFRFRGGLLEFIGLLDDAALLDWTHRHTRCPNAMVDRITPRPPPELRARVQAATGWEDLVPVTGESFIQWVIEDDFAGPRPAWERVGVQLVQSVLPYEEAKIRILNASHSCIAWAGTLIGLTYIHEGTHHPDIRRMAFDYVTDDVIPCLMSAQPTSASGAGQPGVTEQPEKSSGSASPVDLPAYRDVVLDRFGNPAIRDTNQRVAMDGFSKLPSFIAPTLRERLAANQPIEAVAMLPALFLAFLQRWHTGRLSYVYHDQNMDEALAHAMCAATDPVAALCDDRALWGNLASDPRLVAAIRRASLRVEDFVDRHSTIKGPLT